MAKISVPSNRIFRLVHKSKHRYIAMKGSAGSGKSVDAAQQYILRLLSEKGRNLLCARKSEVTNRDSTYAELRAAANRMGVIDYFRFTLSPLEITAFNGNKVIFRGMNDDRQREKIKSITFANGALTDIWVEEATEFTQQDVDILDDRLRGELADGLFYQMKLTFNPVAATHWLKGAFFDIKSDDVLTHHSTYLDNRFIDEAYHRRMMRRKELDPEGYKVYGLGEWGETGGLILTNYQVDDLNTNLEHYDAVALGQDFGFNHANAILLLGYKDGNVYVLDEIYVHEKETSEIIALADKKPRWDEPYMFCDSAEPDRIKTWRGAGYRAVEAKKPPGSVHAQIDWLKGRKVFINSHCVNTLKEIGQWKWKRDDKRAVYLDEPVPFMDDAMAALRYGVQGWRPRKSGKTRVEI